MADLCLSLHVIPLSLLCAKIRLATCEEHFGATATQRRSGYMHVTIWVTTGYCRRSAILRGGTGCILSYCHQRHTDLSPEDKILYSTPKTIWNFGFNWLQTHHHTIFSCKCLSWQKSSEFCFVVKHSNNLSQSSVHSYQTILGLTHSLSPGL